jgi:hypothetical protein
LNWDIHGHGALVETRPAYTLRASGHALAFITFRGPSSVLSKEISEGKWVEPRLRRFGDLTFVHPSFLASKG